MKKERVQSTRRFRNLELKALRTTARTDGRGMGTEGRTARRGEMDHRMQPLHSNKVLRKETEGTWRVGSNRVEEVSFRPLTKNKSSTRTKASDRGWESVDRRGTQRSVTLLVRVGKKIRTAGRGGKRGRKGGRFLSRDDAFGLIELGLLARKGRKGGLAGGITIRFKLARESYEGGGKSWVSRRGKLRDSL